MNNVKIKEKTRVWEKNNKVRHNKSVNERIKIRKKEDVLDSFYQQLNTLVQEFRSIQLLLQHQTNLM